MRTRYANLTPEQKERERVATIKQRYGITPEQWEQMFEDQGRRCAICNSDHPKIKTGRWATDHCHASLGVRGILCHSCNVGLGNFKDNPAFLRAAAEYLETI